MATQMQMHHDVLHATDTALRLVNQALGDLGDPDAVLGPAAANASPGVREGLDRALAVVAELEQEAPDPRDPLRHARYAALRDALHGVIAQVRPRTPMSQPVGDAAALAADATGSAERRAQTLGPR